MTEHWSWSASNLLQFSIQIPIQHYNGEKGCREKKVVTSHLVVKSDCVWQEQMEAPGDTAGNPIVKMCTYTFTYVSRINRRFVCRSVRIWYLFEETCSRSAVDPILLHSQDLLGYSYEDQLQKCPFSYSFSFFSHLCLVMDSIHRAMSGNVLTSICVATYP